MIRKYTSAAARENFGALLKQVEARHGRVLITHRGKAVAALVNVDLFERIGKLREEFQKLKDALDAGNGAGLEGAPAEGRKAASKVRSKGLRTANGGRSAR
jgi:prevent-host-death family protein